MRIYRHTKTNSYIVPAEDFTVEEMTQEPGRRTAFNPNRRQYTGKISVVSTDVQAAPF